MRDHYRKQQQQPLNHQAYAPVRQMPDIARHGDAVQAEPRFDYQRANMLSAKASQQTPFNNNFQPQQQLQQQMSFNSNYQQPSMLNIFQPQQQQMSFNNNYQQQNMPNNFAAPPGQVTYYKPPHFSKKEQLVAFHNRDRAPEHFLGQARTENLMARKKVDASANSATNATLPSDSDLFKEINLEIIPEPGEFFFSFGFSTQNRKWIKNLIKFSQSL